MRKIYLFGVVAGLATASGAEAPLIRVGTGAVADAVEAKGAVDTLYISGITPAALDPSAPTVSNMFSVCTLVSLRLLTPRCISFLAMADMFGDLRRCLERHCPLVKVRTKVYSESGLRIGKVAVVNV